MSRFLSNYRLFAKHWKWRGEKKSPKEWVQRKYRPYNDCESVSHTVNVFAFAVVIGSSKINNQSIGMGGDKLQVNTHIHGDKWKNANDHCLEWQKWPIWGSWNLLTPASTASTLIRSFNLKCIWLMQTKLKHVALTSQNGVLSERSKEIENDKACHINGG